MEVNLSEEDRQAIIDLMKKISDLDLNIDSLREQAKSLYDRIAGLDLNLNIDEEQVKGFFEKILDFFKTCFHKKGELLLPFIYFCFFLRLSFRP